MAATLGQSFPSSQGSTQRVMIRRRGNRRNQGDAAKLEAALLGVPVGADDDLKGLVVYGRLLKPKPLDNAALRAAERSRLLSEAMVASAATLDLLATTVTDNTEAVHTYEVTLDDGGTVRVADVEVVTEHAAAQVAAQTVRRAGALRR
jgi:hypothetical protein